MDKQKQQFALMLVIGVLIGMTGVMAWKSHVGEWGASDDTTATNASGSKEIATTTSSIMHAPDLPSAPEIPQHTRFGLSVGDQPAGKSVDVGGLSLTENHWVAIYDEREGKPGWILGAARAHPGDVGITVDLIRNTEKGATYYAAILNDDGDDTFNRETDLPPLSPDKVVIVSFTAQ